MFLSKISPNKSASIPIKLWLVLLLVACFQLKGQDNPPNDTIRLHLATDTTQQKKSFVKKVIYEVSKKRKFLLAPELGRSPLTGFYTGIYYLQLFKLKGDTDSRTSNIETYGTVTEKHQFYLTLNNTVLFDHEKYFWRGNTYISKFNEFFYGLGNNIDVNTKDLINFNYFNSLQRVTRNVKPHTYLGLQAQFNKTYSLSYDKGGLLDESTAYGKGGSQNLGVGPLFLYDSRDHVIYTRTGTYLDVSAMFFQKAFGSQYPFTNMIIDFRKFIKFYKNDVLSFQTLINYNWGNVPFRQLALMGGDVMMRGYYPGIYRDNFMMVQQVELRIPVYKIFGIVLFAAAAEVQHTLQAFNWQDVKYTYGVGLRIMFIKHERINVGGDLGFSKNTKTLSLGSGESF
ncbi:MAG TPA: BamA/TamA family outer membrane protein [Bacteroidia bacterium]|nr:BamA/TamA family outer membrane protein [Bacteroidia bacterium]